MSTEADFAKLLASNQPKLADKALKKVFKWLQTRSVVKDAFTEDSLLKIWKGLFYYFWNSDKPLVQEEKADIISGFIHQFKTVNCSFLFIDTFFQTMAREWLAIDRYRLEKFMMLVRKFLHQTYQLLKDLKWEIKWIKKFRKLMKKSVISSFENISLGLRLHISDIYMEELAKVAGDELTPEVTQLFLVPYCRVFVDCDDPIYLESISKDVFVYLINQNADEEEFEEFPVLNFDASAVQTLLMKYASKPSVKKTSMKFMYNVVKQFEDYKNGVSAQDKLFNDTGTGRKLRKRDIEKAALNLFKDEVSYSEEKKSVKKKKLSENIIDL